MGKDALVSETLKTFQKKIEETNFHARARLRAVWPGQFPLAR
jgi:hypothetical protein